MSLKIEFEIGLTEVLKPKIGINWPWQHQQKCYIKRQDLAVLLL